MGNRQPLAAAEMRRLIWAAEALADLARIERYVADYRPIAALRLTDRLAGTAEALLEMPDRGRRAANGIRTLAAVKPYLISYVVTDEAVTILRVRHAARRRR